MEQRILKSKTQCRNYTESFLFIFSSTFIFLTKSFSFCFFFLRRSFLCWFTVFPYNSHLYFLLLIYVYIIVVTSKLHHHEVNVM